MTILSVRAVKPRPPVVAQHPGAALSFIEGRWVIYSGEEPTPEEVRVAINPPAPVPPPPVKPIDQTAHVKAYRARALSAEAAHDPQVARFVSVLKKAALI